MLLSISTTFHPATDLGFLLHKNPANLHTAELSFGNALVFYPEASADRCTACLLVEVDPVGLVRGARQLEQYVNDRPYVSSSYLTVAMGRLFGTALAGNCQKRPELVNTPFPLELIAEVVRARRADLLSTLFEPLGYQVETKRLPLDEKFPEWGESQYFRLQLRGTLTVHDALSHLYVLLPVLDDDKHYYIGEAEVEKLLRHGEGWLQRHPARDLIVSRYLLRKSSLMDQAFEMLLREESPAIEAAEDRSTQAAQVERNLERPLTLHTLRLNTVADKVKQLGAKTVVDLGCGEGKLLRRLLADRSFERIVGMDVSHRSLEIATSRLRLDRMPDRQRQRISLVQGSLLYRDKRLNGFDAATLVEVIEHLDPPRLAVLERVLFEFMRPRHIIITTPNREYNTLFPTLPPGTMRHSDHRFEWTRAELRDWSERVANRFGYKASFEDIGPLDPQQGAPSQLASFTLAETAA